MVGDLNTKIQEMDPKVQANQAAQDKKIQQRQELDNALKLLNQSAYAKSYLRIQYFIQKNRGSEFYPEAMYWLGKQLLWKGETSKSYRYRVSFSEELPSPCKGTRSNADYRYGSNGY